MELTDEGLTEFLSTTLPLLNERQRRLVAAAMATALGRGGQARVAAATGLARNTIVAGARELADDAAPSERVRRPGAGRKRAVALDPSLLVVLDSLIEPPSPGDPIAPLRWTAKTTKSLSSELDRLGHRAGPALVRRVLLDLGYHLHTNAAETPGTRRPDRDRQFVDVDTQARQHLAAGQPVISVDCTRTVSLDDAGAGSEREPERPDVEWRSPPDPAGPGTLDDLVTVLAARRWGTIGDDDEALGFAVTSIAQWWERVGRVRYPQATALMIAASPGTSLLRRRRAQLLLAPLARSNGLVVTVCHMPAGTYRWNDIAHRLTMLISTSGTATPAATDRTVVELVAAAATGRTVEDQSRRRTPRNRTDHVPHDPDTEPIGVTDHDWSPDWSYSIRPPVAGAHTSPPPKSEDL